MSQARIDVEAAPPAFRVRGTQLWLTGQRNEARKAWDLSLARARETGGRYDEGLTLLEIGRRAQDRSAVESAVTVFQQIGAQARAQQALDLATG